MNSYFKDYYAILQISPSASISEIKDAYRRLVKINHPDHGGSDVVMQQLNEAYSILQKAETRQEYDIWYAQHFNINQRETQQTSYTPPAKVTIHILDPWAPIEYYTTQQDTSAFRFNIYPYLYRNELYAYQKDVEGKKYLVYISYEEFSHLLVLYHSDPIYCNIVTLFNTKIKKLPVFLIKNNYRAYLQPDYTTLYVKYRNNEYIAITREDFEQLCQKQKSRSSIAITFFAIFFVLLGVGAYWNAPTSEKGKNEQTPSQQTNIRTTSEAALAMPPPVHNTVYADNLYEVPNFTINSQYSDNAKYYYLKIVNATSGTLTQAVFFEAGKTAEVYVPNGTYIVKWVSGSQWYGYENLFLTNSATQAEDTFTFDNETGWEITLYPVSNGNLETNTINIDNF